MSTDPIEKMEAIQAEDVRAMFEELGFTEVRIARTALPEHLAAWMAPEFADEDLTVEDLADELVYYRVETAEGAFGFFIVAYPCIDLHGTGVSARDLGHEAIEPGIDLLTGPAAFEAGCMARLRDLLRARKSA